MVIVAKHSSNFGSNVIHQHGRGLFSVQSKKNKKTFPTSLET